MNGNQFQMTDAWDKLLLRLRSSNWIDEVYTSAAGLTKIIGPELDFLANQESFERNQVRLEVMGLLSKIEPIKKIAVLAVVRNEACNLLEWIAHYRAIGVDHFFVYTNDNNDGTDELLSWLSNNIPLTVIHSESSNGTNIQFKHYEHALTLLPEIRLFEWVVIVDADEFLVPAPKYDFNLPAMLSSAKTDIDAILFPWKWRLWNRDFEWKSGLLSERFPHCVPNDLFKPVTRLRHVTSLRHLHWPTLIEDRNLYDTNFEIIPADRILTKWVSKTDEGGWIDHYWGRSFEEFLIKKHRGDSANVPDGHWKRDFETFFQWSSKPNAQNYSPISEVLLKKVKIELLNLEKKSGYRRIKDHIDSLHLSYIIKTRSDSSLRNIFNNYLSDNQAG